MVENILKDLKDYRNKGIINMEQAKKLGIWDIGRRTGSLKSNKLKEA